MTTSLACPQCGAAVDAAAERCPQCGAALAAAPPPSLINAIPPPPLVPPTPVSAGAQVFLQYGEIEQAMIFAGMMRALRGIAIGLIIWGALYATIGSISGMFMLESARLGGSTAVTMATAIIIFFCLIGLALIAEGIWLIIAPSGAGLMVAAITMFVSAVLVVRGILIAIILIFYGVALIKRHGKYGPLLRTRPSAALLAEADAILDRIVKAKCAQDPEVIEFASGDLIARRYWRALLQNDHYIMVMEEARVSRRSVAEVMFVSLASVRIEVTSKDLSAKWLKGVLYVNDITAKGKIRREEYERYLTWRQQRGLTV